MFGMVKQQGTRARASRGRRALAGLALACASALAGSAAHAGMVDFNGAEPGFLMDGASVSHGGYQFSAGFVGNPDEGGGLLGALIDGSDIGLCSNFSCPQNNSTTYLGAFNDAMISMYSAGAGLFHLLGFDASYFGHDLEGEPYIAGVLQVSGVRADGSRLDEYFALNTSLGGFNHYFTSDEFGASAFASIEFFTYSCNFDGKCDAFNSDQGQFALDDLLVSADVPEPATLGLFAAGFAMLRMRARRRFA